MLVFLLLQKYCALTNWLFAKDNPQHIRIGKILAFLQGQRYLPSAYCMFVSMLFHVRELEFAVLGCDKNRVGLHDFS